VSLLVDLHRVIDDQLGRKQGIDAGTPVKSCMITRAGIKAISVDGSASGRQRASDSMWAAVTPCPSSRRSKFSRRILSEKGKRAMSSPASVSLPSRKIS
jgi:hypothetical protein